MNDAGLQDVAVFEEPLAESALLALEWSKRHCVQALGQSQGCAWYHGSWQVLRLLGVFHSIRSDDDFFLPTLNHLLADGVRNILISGAADYALLARVVAAAAAQLGSIRVTVIDRCATPLRLNSWYGERAGVEVQVVQGDILELVASEQFDLVCTHSFICFFDPHDRQRLLKSWWDCLRPGGRVLTAQRARTLDHNPVIRYPEAEVQALVERARHLAEAQFPALGIAPELASRLALGYGLHHWTYLVRTADDVRTLFLDRGFELEIFEPPGGQQPISDTPGTPNQGGSVRWRVLAKKPA
jgi:SAM-dependent methyltransferase